MLDQGSSRPIFVVGVTRSGTTLLRLCLNSHPRIAIPYESHFVGRYSARRAEFGDLEVAANRERLVDALLAERFVKLWDHTFDRARLLASIEEHSLAGVLRALYRDYARAHGKPRWGDKSSYVECLPEIHALFPSAQFVHLIRDGRDVAASVQKLRWDPADVIGAARWWKHQVMFLRDAGRAFGPERYFELRYEELVADPERELRAVCRFLGEDFDAAMLGYASSVERTIPDARRFQHVNTDRAPDPARAHAWKTTMATEDVALFELFAGDVLEQLGYARANPRVGALRLARAGWRALLERFEQTQR